MKTTRLREERRAAGGRSGARRAPRRNLRRSRPADRTRAWLQRLLVTIGVGAVAAAVIFISFLFIFVHDVFTQSEHFKAKLLAVEGARRLSRQTVLELAGIREGVNVLSVNLSAAHKRLLAHPWIAEAEIRRDIPSGLSVRIREHVPAAVVDIGKKFLLSEQGEIFKEWDSSDPHELPVVTGLKPGDLVVADRSGAAALLPLFSAPGSDAPQAPASRPMAAVLHVLTLGREEGGILPNRQIRTIQVDRELGLTLIAFEESRTIRLGYTDYPTKYRLLSELLAFLKVQPGAADFDRIDLTDPNRIIVNPVRAELPKAKGPQGG